jgi:hypothetical protein
VKKQINETEKSYFKFVEKAVPILYYVPVGFTALLLLHMTSANLNRNFLPFQHFSYFLFKRAEIFMKIIHTQKKCE